MNNRKRPMSNMLPRKSVSIESLLTWAYRDQLVHVAQRVELVALAPTHGHLGYAGNGYALEVVDSSRPVAFTAAPDAFAVHDAVRSLSRVEATMPPGVVGTCASALHSSVLPEVKPTFSVDRAKLVTQCAMDGHQPDWIPDPVIAIERGKVIYAKNRFGQIKRDARGAQVAEICAVEFIGDKPWEVEKARITYKIWAWALRALRVTLRPVLTRHTLNEELPNIEPWTASHSTARRL